MFGRSVLDTTFALSTERLLLHYCAALLEHCIFGRRTSDRSQALLVHTALILISGPRIEKNSLDCEMVAVTNPPAKITLDPNVYPSVVRVGDVTSESAKKASELLNVNHELCHNMFDAKSGFHSKIATLRILESTDVSDRRPYFASLALHLCHGSES